MQKLRSGNKGERFKMNFNLKQERQKMMLSQKELATKLGVTIQSVCNWENGAPISITNKRKIMELIKKEQQ